MSQFQAGSARDIRKEAAWFRDTEGRYVLFRGVNFASRSKRPPYLPILPLNVTQLDESGAAQFDRELKKAEPFFGDMRQNGFNIVRLLVSWKAIEPRPNPDPEVLLLEGQHYLRLVGKIIDALYAHDIFVIIDFHQDIVHETCGGDGFPDWALAIDDQHSRPVPPSNLEDRFWGLNYVEGLFDGLLHRDFSSLVRHTLRALWQNDLYNTELNPAEIAIARPVRTHLEKTIGATARFFQALNSGAGHPGILGYEAFNEPHQAGLPKTDFERRLLPQYYSNVLREIRRSSPTSGLAGDQRAFLFVEPRVDWTTYAIDIPSDYSDNGGPLFTQSPQTLLKTDDFDNDHVVFSFHYYDPWTVSYGLVDRPDNMHNKEREWPKVYAQMRDAAVSRGLIPFLTEFGGSQD